MSAIHIKADINRLSSKMNQGTVKMTSIATLGVYEGLSCMAMCDLFLFPKP